MVGKRKNYRLASATPESISIAPTTAAIVITSSKTITDAIIVTNGER